MSAARRLTPRQLDMLTRMHRDGAVIVHGGARRTAHGLATAGLAYWRNAQAGGAQYVPTDRTRPWADGYGIWHVTIPATLAPSAAAAIIRGAALRLDTTDETWTPDVELVAVDPDGRTYRERADEDDR